jgi:hypothetical protein
MTRGSSREEDASLLPSLRATSAAERAAPTTHIPEDGAGGDEYLPFNLVLRVYNARLDAILQKRREKKKLGPHAATPAVSRYRSQPLPAAPASRPFLPSPR